MLLREKYLPEHSFREAHSKEVYAHPRAILDAVTAYRPESDPFFRSMIFLREAPMRIGGFVRTARPAKAPPFGQHNFTLLERLGDHEVIYGLVGRFWRPNFGLEHINHHLEFLAFKAPGVAKLTLGFSVGSNKNGTSTLTTETCVFCPDLECKLKFAPYWYLIRPVSGLIRSRILTAIKSASERDPESSLI